MWPCTEEKVLRHQTEWTCGLPLRENSSSQGVLSLYVLLDINIKEPQSMRGSTITKHTSGGYVKV